MEPRIISKPAFSVVGLKIRAQGGSPEIPRLWDSLMSRAHEIVGKVSDAAYGVIDRFDAAGGQFDYVAGFEVEGSHQLPSGMTVLHVPGHRYAVFDCTLPTLMEALDQADHKWLPSSAYRRARGWDFEFYDEQFDPANPSSPMSIYIPVRAR